MGTNCVLRQGTQFTLNPFRILKTQFNIILFTLNPEGI
jgi:hypothetical protein